MEKLEIRLGGVIIIFSNLRITAYGDIIKIKRYEN
nr:MAG TPA: hypothetical protein [Caudoviricetes sp.]